MIVRDLHFSLSTSTSEYYAARAHIHQRYRIHDLTFLRKVQGDQQSYNGHWHGMVPMGIVRAVRLWLVSRQVSPSPHTNPSLPLLISMNQLGASSMS